MALFGTKLSKVLDTGELDTVKLAITFAKFHYADTSRDLADTLRSKVLNDQALSKSELKTIGKYVRFFAGQNGKGSVTLSDVGRVLRLADTLERL